MTNRLNVTVRIEGFPMRVTMWCLTIAMAASIIGCGPDFRQLRRDGQMALRAHDYPAAQEQFEQVYRVWPEDAAMLCLMPSQNHPGTTPGSGKQCV